MKRILVRRYPKRRYALIDDEDAELVAQYRWYRGAGGYIYGIKKGDKARKYVYLHRLVMEITDGRIECDHINRRPHDCRKGNLRLCQHKQNMWNSHRSPYKGVRWTGKRWAAVITCNGKIHQIGSYHRAIDAARAYNEKAEELFGEFACLNPIRGRPKKLSRAS